ncbi:hypothetical protein STEG23_021774 [Scotinomys teguina]
MDWLGQRTHCGPNVAAPNPRQPYLGDFTADGLDQLTLCLQSPGFGTPAAPVQVLFKETESGQSTSVSKLTIGHPKSVLSCRHRWPGRLFSLPNNLALSLRCRRRFQEAPLSSEQAVLLQPSPAQPSPGTMSQRCDTEAVAGLRHTGSTCAGDFTADGLDQLTLCSQSPGFGTPAAPVQVLFKETESGKAPVCLNSQ